MIKHHVKSLIDESSLKERVNTLGKSITTHYESLIPAEAGQQLVLVGLLRGSFVFMADLSRVIQCPHSIDFMTASSYGSGTKSSGDVKILKDLEDDIEGKHVLVVEDIIDSGNTLSTVKQILALRNPASLAICTLLDKPSRREVQVDVQWVGFSIEDRFVVGYGIDYAEHYRHLPYIGEVIPD
ncbi:hypoxanthine phosphoribosyltransferase [Thorsellia anophelis]|uniref:Hypoxanthine phosphoribosyltransferase n=1 Tax=Thorsellia anophelis DSM 18579 TaxID=1123402 RepID=A0A1I0B169_9GAMM|nr:hypoxanthine phosphoribosyltransferase [Thorsellia anophelis]SET00437.1 hypoxanthine phosphoribosyltransferase [Thorsellia anophelis DSM 18579]